MHDDQLNAQDADASASDGKLPYHAPTLRRHGTVAEVTLCCEGGSFDDDGETYIPEPAPVALS
jgi:hypothetical protein